MNVVCPSVVTPYPVGKVKGQTCPRRVCVLTFMDVSEDMVSWLHPLLDGL